jgi:hypothetical protein
MSLRLRLPSPRRGGMERQTTQTFVTNNNNALIEARMNLSEAAEPVGEIVTRPVRVERDSKAEISSVEMGIGPHFSMSVAQRGTHAVVGAKNGGIAVVTLSSLYSGSPQIVTAKLPSSSTSSGVVVACSATAETIAAYTTKASKVYVYSRTLSLKTEITRAKPIRAIAVSSDGSKVAIGCENKQVSVYSISLVGQSLSMEYDVKELVENYPCSLAFSQSGKVLAMGGDFRKGCVWSTSSRSAEPLRVFARGGVIGAIAFSKSDKWMAMGSSGDQLLTLIDTATWEIHDEVPQSGSVTAVSFSADELALGCVSNKVRASGRTRASPGERGGGMRECARAGVRSPACVRVRARARVRAWAGLAWRSGAGRRARRRARAHERSQCVREDRAAHGSSAASRGARPAASCRVALTRRPAYRRARARVRACVRAAAPRTRARPRRCSR